MRNEVAATEPKMGSSFAVRLVAASVLVVAAAGTALSARAQGMESHGPGPGAGMMMLGGSPEHMGRGIDRMLDGLGVTDAQRTQIKQIAMAAAADLKAQREAERALREKGMQIFVAPTVDAAAAESVRQQMQSQRDQSSKRVLQAMLDASKVLTPEQRAKLGERVKERRAVMEDRMKRMQHEHGPRPQPQK